MALGRGGNEESRQLSNTGRADQNDSQEGSWRPWGQDGQYRFLPLHHLPWMFSNKANCRIFFLENIPSTHQGVLIRYGLGLVDRVLDFLRIVALQFSKLWGGLKTHKWQRVIWMWEGDLGVWWEERGPEAVVFLVHWQSHLWPWERKLQAPVTLQTMLPTCHRQLFEEQD